jgi:ABC-type branched-subunit amino acid transport system substrate-binding protein
MTHVRSARLVAAALVGALVLTACGQRPGVHVEGGGQFAAAPGQNQPGTGQTGGDTGSLDGGGTSDPGTDTDGQTGGQDGGQVGGTAGGTTDGGGTTGGEDTGGDGNNNTQQQQGQLQPTGSDRTGVTDEKITVAFHAPVTGAAPLPAESFREATDLYWLWEKDKGRTFLGRQDVEVLFRDDQYRPSNAIQVCRELRARAFLVGGGGGTDQIQACGQLAEVEAFPYFSAGVTERGLENNPWYFAASMSYRQQGILLAHYIKKNFPGQKFGAIITQTSNFDDAKDGFEAGIQQAGLGDLYVGTERHPKGEQAWIRGFGATMADRGAEVLYMLTSPVDYIQFAQQNKDRGFQYVGVGVSMGLNAVLNSGCPEVGGGIFFSPFPGLDWARENVPEFFQASSDFGTVPDDLALALWGTNKQLDLMFQRYEQVFGTDLTREDFRALVEGAGRVESGIFPAVEFSPQNHFGGQSVHVLQANCKEPNPESGNFEYETLATFSTGF